MKSEELHVAHRGGNSPVLTAVLFRPLNLRQKGLANNVSRKGVDQK